MAFLRALFFLALAIGEFYALYTLALTSSSLLRATPIMSSPDCFKLPGMTTYPRLGPKINQILCSLNMLFMAGAHGPRTVQLQMSTFGALFLSSIVIGTYECFRPVHRRSNFLASGLARASSAFLFLGQRFTAGFTTPLHNVFTTWSAASGMAATMSRRNTPDERLKALIPESKYVWTTLFSIVGYLAPTLYMQAEDFSYFSLSLWHPFPLYIMALNTILPPILSALPNTRLVATVLITLLCTVVSAVTHLELMKETVLGRYDLRDVFFLRQQPKPLSLAYGAHILFQIDFVAVLITCMVSVLTGYGAGASNLLGNLIPFALITAAAGPGAAVIIFWAIREIALQRSYARAIKGKKTQ